MKIAFLCLFIDNPNHPKIWDEYFDGNDDKFNLYIHCKNRENVSWRKENVIGELVETEWGKIVSAYMELFKEAVKDQENVMFVTVSESCVPINSFDSFYRFCMKDISKSWICPMKLKKYDRIEIIEKHAKTFGRLPPVKRIIKHRARFCINRDSVEELIKKEFSIEMCFFKSMFIGDEYFLSCLSNLSEYEVTFDDWDYTNGEVQKLNKQIKSLYEIMERGGPSKKSRIEMLKDMKARISGSPKTIGIVETVDLNNIMRSCAFFYRKFSRESDIEEYWRTIIVEKKKKCSLFFSKKKSKNI